MPGGSPPGEIPTRRGPRSRFVVNDDLQERGVLWTSSARSGAPQLTQRGLGGGAHDPAALLYAARSPFGDHPDVQRTTLMNPVEELPTGPGPSRLVTSAPCGLDRSTPLGHSARLGAGSAAGHLGPASRCDRLEEIAADKIEAHELDPDAASEAGATAE